MPSGTRKRAWLRVVMRLAGGALILGLLFYFVPFADAWRALRRLPPLTWLAVLALYLSLHLVGVTKYKLMLNGADAGLNFVQSVRCYFAGLFSTLFLPSVIGGDVVKAGLALRISPSKAGVLLGSVLDRMLDGTALITLAALGALLAPTLGLADRRGFLLILEILGAAALLAVILLVFLPIRRFPYRIRRWLVKLRRAWLAIKRRPKRVAVALGLAFIVQIGFLTLTAVIGAACGLDLPYRAWLFAWPLAKISAFAPVGQAGIGVREAALAGLLVPFGAGAGVVVGVGLAWDTIIIAGGLVSGAVSLVASRLPAGKAQPLKTRGAQRYDVRPS